MLKLLVDSNRLNDTCNQLLSLSNMNKNTTKDSYIRMFYISESGNMDGYSNMTDVTLSNLWEKTSFNSILSELMLITKEFF